MASEQEGLLLQKEILIKRLNYLRKEYAIASDAGQRFTLQMQIAEVEKEMEAIDAKIASGQIEQSSNSRLVERIKQYPNGIYIFNMVASAILCYLFSLFFNNGFVQGNEKINLWVIFYFSFIVENWFFFLIIGSITLTFASFFVITLLQITPIFINNSFIQKQKVDISYTFYFNLFYYIVPLKFQFLFDIATSGVLFFFILWFFILIYCYYVLFLFYTILYIFASFFYETPEFNFLSYLKSVIGDENDFIRISLIFHPIGTALSILLSFFILFAVNHPVAIALYNML